MLALVCTPKISAALPITSGGRFSPLGASLVLIIAQKPIQVLGFHILNFFLDLPLVPTVVGLDSLLRFPRILLRKMLHGGSLGCPFLIGIQAFSRRPGLPLIEAGRPGRR
jgi:hypothetical protein